MPLFIILNLSLSFIVQTANPLPTALASPVLIYIGLTGAAIGIAGTVFKKQLEKIWYDLFASSALLVWFPYWTSSFNDDSPMFFFFPLFFAGFSTFASMALIGQRHRIDAETLRWMRILSEQNGLQPWVIMLGVLGSLELQAHFQVFPVMMTLLVLRFTLASCIDHS